MTDAFAETFPGAPLNGLVDAKTGSSWAAQRGEHQHGHGHGSRDPCGCCAAVVAGLDGAGRLAARRSHQGRAPAPIGRRCCFQARPETGRETQPGPVLAHPAFPAAARPGRRDRVIVAGGPGCARANCGRDDRGLRLVRIAGRDSGCRHAFARDDRSCSPTPAWSCRPPSANYIAGKPTPFALDTRARLTGLERRARLFRRAVLGALAGLSAGWRAARPITRRWRRRPNRMDLDGADAGATSERDRESRGAPAGCRDSAACGGKVVVYFACFANIGLASIIFAGIDILATNIVITIINVDILVADIDNTGTIITTANTFFYAFGEFCIVYSCGYISINIGTCEIAAGYAAPGADEIVAAKSSSTTTPSSPRSSPTSTSRIAAATIFTGFCFTTVFANPDIGDHPHFAGLSSSPWFTATGTLAGIRAARAHPAP